MRQEQINERLDISESSNHSGVINDNRINLINDPPYSIENEYIVRGNLADIHRGGSWGGLAVAVTSMELYLTEVIP